MNDKPDREDRSVRLGGARGDLLLSVVYSLYRTIQEKDRWPAILKQIQDLLDADTCSISVHDFRTKKGTIAIHSGCFDDHYLKLYNETYCSLDPWLRREEHYRVVDGSWVGDELVPQAQLVTTQFYNEWLRPQGLIHHCSGILLREKDNLVYLSSFRSAQAGPFGRDTLHPLQRLLPHLRQTFELQDMLASIASEVQPLGEMVRRLGSATMIVDAERRLLAMSAEAEQMLASGAPLRLENGELSAATSEQTRRLQNLLEAAMKSADGKAGAPGGSIELADAQGASTIIKAGCLPADSFSGQRQTAVYLTITGGRADGPAETERKRRWLPLVLRPAELEAKSPAPIVAAPDPHAQAAVDGELNEDRLRRLYSLTPSEGRLAELLAAGYGLPRACRQLGVGLNTVRTHLQRIFSKTDTHHQSELVALLLLGPAKLRVQFHRPNGDDCCEAKDEDGVALAAPSLPGEKMRGSWSAIPSALISRVSGRERGKT